MSEHETRIPRDPRAFGALALLCALYAMTTELKDGPAALRRLMRLHAAGGPLWEAWAEAREMEPDEPELMNEAVRALNQLVASSVNAGEERIDAVDDVTRLLGYDA